MELTTGEKLTVLRRRNKITQNDVADKYHVSQMTVSLWEADEIPFPGILNEVTLEEGEECYILRRRAGLSVRDAAKKMHVSHVTLIKWERDGPPNREYKNFLLGLLLNEDAE
jgi:transcriptional regulator with XRE-family HTH domain